MGETYKIACKCGYGKELNTGGGLAACNINMVNKVFQEEKTKEFYTCYRNNEVQSFLIENQLSFCDECKEIMTVTVLKAQLTNDRKLIIINDCSQCGNKVQIINDSNICPKCGREIFKEYIGHWD